MSEEEQSELFKKVFTNTLRKLAEEPEELFDNDKLQKKYNNLLREQIKLKKQLQQKENIIKDIKAQLDYLEIYSSKEDVFEDMKRRLDRIEKIIGENNDK